VPATPVLTQLSRRSCCIAWPRVCLLGDTLVEGTAERDNPAAWMVAPMVTWSAARKDCQQMADFPPARNRLLAALRTADPAAEAQLREGLESVELALHDKVMGPDRLIEHVYFPETGVLSQIQQMRNGSAVEVNLVGSDGIAGLAVYLGSVTFPMEVACSAPGTFLRMRSADFLAEVARNPPLLKVLHGYTQAVLEIRAQAIGCDRFHAVEARAARWLLEMDDRVPEDEFTMTHESLALMLGVRRQTVSAVASHLCRQGLIVYRRGFIEVVDRVGLEGASCECYEFIRDEFARLVGPPVPRERKAQAATFTTR
jgi:CRP-like cAMP-binding protein